MEYFTLKVPHRTSLNRGNYFWSCNRERGLYLNLFERKRDDNYAQDYYIFGLMLCFGRFSLHRFVLHRPAVSTSRQIALNGSAGVSSLRVRCLAAVLLPTLNIQTIRCLHVSVVTIFNNNIKFHPFFRKISQQTHMSEPTGRLDASKKKLLLPPGWSLLLEKKITINLHYGRIHWKTRGAWVLSRSVSTAEEHKRKKCSTKRI